MSNLDKYKKDLEKLIKDSYKLQLGMIEELNLYESAEDKELIKKLKKMKKLEFKSNYEKWYTEAQAVIFQIIPERLDDFTKLYKNEKRKELNHSSYVIADYLIGLVGSRLGETIVDGKAAFPKFQQQMSILASARKKFESSLFDIRQLTQADLFDSELDAARELNKKGFTRGAGAIAGVVLEGHLSQVCKNHKIKIVKKEPTINDLNQLLKDNDVIDVPTWRFVQHLADLRNLCDHKKKKEPQKEEIEELIKGVEKMTKTLF